MIDRYMRAPMAALWSKQARFAKWLEVELHAADAWCVLGVVPEDDARAMRRNAAFTVERIEEIEQSTHHDVVAFTRCVAEHLGGESKYLHYGLTSTDVVDTALSAVLNDACGIIEDDLQKFLDAVRARALEHQHTPIMGRTHGVHAEPTTLGLKLAIWYAETQRNIERFRAARQGIAVGKISGAVGTYANVDPFVERYVCEKMGLAASPISTQVLSRDRHAALLSVLALIASCLEKYATEIRGLQKTETRELEEPFGTGQKGSSAMPHKRNPVKCEQICGLSRLMRGYAMAAFEDIPLWHERDISHSSCERVILPDATALLDYMLTSLTSIVRGMRAYPENMLANMDKSFDLTFSQHVLLALIGKGMLREDAYDIVQRCAMRAWEERTSFRALAQNAPELQGRMTPEEWDACFDITYHFKRVDEIFERLGLRA